MRDDDGADIEGVESVYGDGFFAEELRRREIEGRSFMTYDLLQQLIFDVCVNLFLVGKVPQINQHSQA